MGIGEALGRQDLIRAGDVRSNDDHLAGKLAAKEIPVSLVETSSEIGERIRRNVVGPASKSYGYRISHGGGNPLIGKADAIGDDPRRDAERARRQFERHGRNESFLGREDERGPADHVVDVGVDVQRTQIGATPDGEPLPDCREYRFVAALRLSEDDLSSSSAAGERPQVVAIEAPKFVADSVVPKANLRIFDRAGEDHVEADDSGASLNRRRNHTSYVAGPGQRRGALEWRGRIGLLVEGDDDGRGIARRAPFAESEPAQGRLRIQRPAPHRIRGRQRNAATDDQRNQYDRQDLEPSRPPHRNSKNLTARAETRRGGRAPGFGPVLLPGRCEMSPVGPRRLRRRRRPGPAIGRGSRSRRPDARPRI